MHLKSLELQGFKSFPDKTVIQFGGDMTAIVGPNGSGKSNISDAILWVMGEQSSKTLRGAKMEDVIFGGTEKRAPVGFAEATLYLDNRDRALPYDADEVMVTRRFFRSGDGEFYINRQSARLKDIHELFMDTGLGREGYSNVSQGRIDEILSVKSTDRRQIFEEAAGISKYRHRKEETERKLLGTEDNLLRIGDKISELEMQLEPLRVQSEKAKRYLELKAELRSYEITLWLESLEKLAEAAKKAEEDYASSSFVLEQEHSSLDALYEKVERLTEQLRTQDGKMELIRADCSAADASIRQVEGQKSLLEGRIHNNEENITRIREELNRQEDRSSSLDEQIRTGQERMASSAAQLQNLKQELDGILAQAGDLESQAREETRRVLELRQNESELSQSIAGRQADAAALDASKEHADQREQALRDDVAAGKQRLTQTEEGLAQCRRQLQQAEEAVRTGRNAVEGYELRRQQRTQKQQDLEEELRQKKGQLESISARTRVYRAMEADFDSYNKSVRSIMHESQRGGLTGIHGPVSRLIRTDDEYTTAIEIALGAAMQQIVVGNESDAKSAIGFLKRTNGGRATFLPLSTITARTLQEQGLEYCRGFVGVASDLVSCEEPYRAVVRNLLGRIVICQNLDTAIAMAKQYHNRFKIVTLDGQVMNPGGSMTGGSVSKEAGILSRANELQRLTVQEKNLTEQIRKLSGSLDETQRGLSQVMAEMKAASEQLRNAEDEVLRRQGEEKQFEVLLSTLQEAASAADRELEQLQNRSGEDRERAAKLHGQLEAYEEQLQKIRHELKQLTLTQSETQTRIQHLSDLITGRKTQIAALEAEYQSAGENLERLSELSRALGGDRDQKNTLLHSYEEDSRVLSEEVIRLTEKAEECSKVLENLNADLQKARTDRSQTEAAKTKAEREAQEKNKSILTMERACALLEQKKATTALEERQVVDRLWDSYGLTPSTAQHERIHLESSASANRCIAELKRKIDALGTPNLGAIEEYERIGERYSYLTEQRDDVITAKKDLETIIKDITSEMTVIFVEEFGKINTYFQKTFAEMFGGGNGSLILEDPSEPLSCGIEIRVQPPGKQLKTITLLSGGEKAFVAIALYFAILKVRPTPFCMLDEIDAALDDRNVERYASYLRHLCKNTQFIVITHRRGTMEMADVLYGVTMQEQGISKILHMDLNQMEQELGIVE